MIQELDRDLQTVSWVFRPILKCRSSLVPHAQILPGQHSSSSFWHVPWVQQVLILSTALSPFLMHQTAIPILASIGRYMHSCKIILPHTSSAEDKVFQNLIQKLNFKVSGKDTLLWGGKGNYVKHVYQLLTDAGPSIYFPWHLRIWVSSDSQKQNFMLYIVLRNGMHTKVNLAARGFDISVSCSLSKAAEETTAHLYSECEFSCFIWNGVLNLFENRWVAPISDDEWFLILKATRWKCFMTSCTSIALKLVVYEI